jgi:hypothetical protein
VRWYALSAELPDCARESASARVSVATGKGTGLRAARWILLEGDSVALYSLRELPSAPETRRILETFTAHSLPTTPSVP